MQASVLQIKHNMTDYQKLPMSWAALKAEMTEQWNDGRTENLPKS